MNPLTSLLRRPRFPDFDVLLNRWKVTSLATGWRYEQDWETPEVRNVVVAAARNLGLREAARDLGFARCIQGVGVTEAFGDLRSFFTASSLKARPDILQGLAEGWVAASEGAAPLSCTDALTGLSTADHFKRILHDTYEGAEISPHRFVIAKISLPAIPEGATQRWSTLARLGECCERTFTSSGATLTYQRNAITILMPRTQDNYLRVAACHAGLADVLRDNWDTAAISYEPLPSETSGLLQLMDSLSH